MQIRKIYLAILVTYIFHAFGMYECFAEKVEVSQSSAPKKDYVKLDRMFRNGHLTQNGTFINFLSSSVNDISDEEWAYWASNSKRIFDREKVGAVLLGGGHFSLEIMKFFSACSNIEDLTLGGMIDGGTCPQNAFEEIGKLEKLIILELSIFGLNDDYFSVLPKLENLEYLDIIFPSLLVAPEAYKTKKGEILLSDSAIQNIVKASRKLKSIRIFGDNKAGKARFTIEALNELLTLKNLDCLEISSSCFSEESLKMIQKRRLPPFVKIK